MSDYCQGSCTFGPLPVWPSHGLVCAIRHRRRRRRQPRPLFSRNLKADKVDPILSGKWAVMIYEGFLGMDEKQYRFAIAHFCEKQAWSLKTENSGWVGDLAGSVPVRIQAGAGAEYTIDVDPDRWLDFLGIDRTDRVQMYVAPRTSASFVHRQASFFRYSDNVLVEQVSAKAGHLWRRCPEHP
jgi:hypothetical protein